MSFNPVKLGARCDLCPRKGQTPVPPEGPRDLALTVWLGQDPGEQEVKHERPFIGPTGKRTTNIWNTACEEQKTAIPRDEVLILNSASCMPLSKRDAEAWAAADCCYPLVRKFLRGISPDAGILAMGKMAYYTLTGRKKGVGKYQGFYVKLKKLRPLPDFEKMEKKVKRALDKLKKEKTK